MRAEFWHKILNNRSARKRTPYHHVLLKYIWKWQSYSASTKKSPISHCSGRCLRINFSFPTGLIPRTLEPFNVVILLNGWICLHGVSYRSLPRLFGRISRIFMIIPTLKCSSVFFVFFFFSSFFDSCARINQLLNYTLNELIPAVSFPFLSSVQFSSV